MLLNGTTTSPSLPRSTSSLQWYDILSFLVAFFGIVGNACVIYLVKTRSSLKGTSNAFVLSLAVADLLIGLVIQPSKFACDLLPSCDVQLQRVFSELLLYWSVYNLCGMTIERYICIVYPMKHSTFMCKQRASALIGFAWLIPLINFTLHFPWIYSKSIETKLFWLRNFTAVETCTMVGIPSIILVVLYVRIFFVAQKHRKHTANQIGVVNYNKHLTKTVKKENDAENDMHTDVKNRISKKENGENADHFHEGQTDKQEKRKLEINSEESRFQCNDIKNTLEDKGVCEYKNKYREDNGKGTDQSSTSPMSCEVCITKQMSTSDNLMSKQAINEIFVMQEVEQNTQTKISSVKKCKQSIKKRIEQLIPRQGRSGVSVIGSVIGIFLICWGVSLYSSICYYFAQCPVTIATQHVSWFLLLLNSAVNPIVYALFKTDMRTELKRLARCRTTRFARLSDIKINPNSSKN